MSVQRSPKERPIKNADSNSNEASTSRSESQPDLRQLTTSDTEIRQITYRKRKQPDDDLSQKFDRLENKIMSMLSTMSQTQSEKLDKISQDVSVVTDQITQLRSTTAQLVTEQNRLNQELVDIEKFKATIEEKIENITNDLGNLKAVIEEPSFDGPTTSHTKPSTNLSSYENVISEIQERSRRERNVVLTGINEINSKDLSIRLDHDKQEVQRIIKLVYPDCPEPMKVMRLGKYSCEKSRPLKACFASADTVRTILRNKSKMSSDETNIKCYSDQTPLQKKLMDDTRDELKRRTEAGEHGLTIRYIRGVPKIVQYHSKNQAEKETMAKT